MKKANQTDEIERHTDLHDDHSGHRGRMKEHHRGVEQERGRGAGRRESPRGNRGERRGGRMKYGEIRLLVLLLLDEQPRHGYEIIKLLEERSSGSYTPSPGVIYPTLTWLEDMGYTEQETLVDNRKLHRITEEGKAFLAANRVAITDLTTYNTRHGKGDRRNVSERIRHSVENLRGTLRERLKSGPLDEESENKIIAAINSAADAIAASHE